MMKTLLCFKRPKAGSYIGGVVTLCNDYIDKALFFKANNIDIECFNYEIPNDSVVEKLKSLKIQNVIYGFNQIRALKKLLKERPETSVHIHTSRKAIFFKDVLLAKFIRKVCVGKILMTIHVGDIETVFHNKITQKVLIRMMNTSVDKVIFLSERMKGQFIKEGLLTNRTEVLYNFYNIRPIAPDKKKTKSILNILFLGSINREKGIIELLNALSQVEFDFHLDVCGSIIEKSIQLEFEKAIIDLGNKVIYHGYIGKDKKTELLQQSDILVLPSYREGLPISILEAMATSCAIITTQVGAIPEILNSENAVFVAPKNTQELKAAFEYLYEHPTDLQHMKELNFLKSKDFSYITHINKLCNLYK